MNAFSWTIFFILFVAGLIGTAAVYPYALSINPKALEKMKENISPAGGPDRGEKRRLSLPVLVLISILQSIALVGLATFLGLLAGNQVGLGAPILQTALDGGPVMEKILAMAPVTILLGLASGIILLTLEWKYFLPRIPRSLASMDGRTAFWKRVLACFYGGIVEEILMRLFLMGSLVWLLGLLWKTPAGLPAAGAFWVANILAALIFGAGHLPATAMTVKLTRTVVARALLLNGIPGVACGYLFMQYGIESAMLAHFSLDILIHLIAAPYLARLANSLPPDPSIQPV